MEPLAAAGYVMIAATGVTGVLWGAAGGAIAWVVRLRLVWAALLTAGGFLAQEIFLESVRLGAAAFVGLPPLILALLTAWLATRLLEARSRWWRLAIGLAAFIGGLVVGCLCLLTWRFSLWAPSTIGLAADVCLIPFLFLGPKRIPAKSSEE